jgi:hypothetical protein
MQVTLAGPVIAAVAGCTTPLSTVACIDCTLPRDLCAPVPNAIANITKAGTAANAIRHLIFIARPPLAVDCTPQSITTVLWSAGACSRFLPPDAFCRTKSRRGAACCARCAAVQPDLCAPSISANRVRLSWRRASARHLSFASAFRGCLFAAPGTRSRSPRKSRLNTSRPV